MRILAIRGANLASLPEFAIDFTSAPLSTTGLFAITGHTGAGKSTILDALCVSLFDKTPRLSRQGGALIGRAEDDESIKIASNDVRSLLRRGTGSGSAEVDFVGRDGRTYRAVWQVSRARNSSSGRLQGQKISLYDIDSGQPLGGTKTETLELIQEKIGLSYDQFRRSVLLAQGEFAAFLRADGKERAELLEKITGTDIYARLSQAAFRRMRDEEQKFAELQQQLGETEILPEEELARIEATRNGLTGQLEQIRDRQAIIEKSADWYRRTGELLNGIQQAEEELTAARSDVESSMEVRRKLSDVEQAEPLRPLLHDLRRTGEDAANMEQRVRDLSSELSTAKLAVENCRLQLQGAQQSASAAERKLAEARPLLDEALKLDTRVAEARQFLDNENELFKTAQDEVGKSKAEQGAIEAYITERKEAIAAIDTWLAKHHYLAPVATEWGRWLHELQRYQTAAQKLQKISATLACAERDRGAAAKEVEKAKTELEKRQQGAEQAKIEVEAAESSSTEVELTAIQQQRQEQQQLVTTARTLTQIANQAREAAKEISAADHEIDKVCKEMMVAGQRLAEIGIEHSRALTMLAEADRALALTRSAMDLAGHRAELNDGEPCPLCGSHEHPYAISSPAVTLVSSLEVRVGELRETVTALEREQAGLQTKSGALKEDEQRETARSKRFSEQLSRLGEQWKEATQAEDGIELPQNPADNGVQDFIEQLVNKREALFESVKAEEIKATEAIMATKAAQEKLVYQQNQLEISLKTFQKGEASHQQFIAKAEELVLEQRQQQKNITEILELLQLPFINWVGWYDSLVADAAHFTDNCTLLTRQWLTATEQRHKEETVHSEALSKLEATAAKIQIMALNLVQKEQALHQREDSLKTLIHERAALFNGRPVSEVEHTLTESAATARSLAAELTKNHSDAESCAASLTGKLDEAIAAEKLAAAEQSKAAENFSAALLQLNKTEQEVQELLALGIDWRNSAQQRLNQLDGKLRDASTILEERRNMSATHQATGLPEIPEESIPVMREELTTSANAVDQQLFDIRHRLQLDAAAKENIAALLPLLEKQRQHTELWQGMGELIGSSDGKKFRSFAQSLTLDILLSMANEHLNSLAPRFSVMRVPLSEMELQMIDNDMGGDIRSVNNISGGESFLVSLALALGLSSLASGTTQIGSLFIDEGFGSLDQDTLDIALSTLDVLQASGRMVGVISHVPGLTERIGTRIEVRPCGGGRSKVQVVGV